MDDRQLKPSLNRSQDFADRVGAKAARKQRARANLSSDEWSGFGMTGVVGWAVVIPTLLGTALGVWIDNRYPGKHSWTLALLVAGLVLGCANAWFWISKENDEMNAVKEEKHE